jgi:hypothetical protein
MATTLTRLMGGPVVFEDKRSPSGGDLTVDILFSRRLLNTDYEIAVIPKS